MSKGTGGKLYVDRSFTETLDGPGASWTMTSMTLDIPVEATDELHRLKMPFLGRRLADVSSDNVDTKTCREEKCAILWESKGSEFTLP